MKQKTSSFLGLSVLALVLCMGFGSALIIYSPTELTGSADSETTATIAFNMENTFSGDLGDITFDFTNLEFGSYSIVSTALSVPEVTETTGIAGGEDLDVTLNIVIPVDQEAGIYEGTMEVFGSIDSGTILTRGTLNITITVTEPAAESNFCEYDDGVSGNPGKLDVNIKDITVEKGFGNDEEWLLLDEIEVEVEIENKGDYKVDDISVEWGIADDSMTDWVIEMDEEDEFNLKDDDEEKLTITFRIDDDDLDMDLDELDGSYRLYVRATGKIDDNDAGSLDGADTCASDYEAVSMEIESDFVILADIEFPELVQCGAEVQVLADVWNIGDDDQDDVSVIIYNKDLGINEDIEIGDVDAFEYEKLTFSFQVPGDAEEKWYTLKFTVYDEDNDVYENDYDEDESVFTVPIKVEGGCSVESQVNVVTNLESGGKAGQELVVSATITNAGEDIATYNLNVAGYADWASSADLDQSTVVLNAAESKDVLITFNVKEDASGKESSFDIIFSGDASTTQHVSGILIEEAGFGFTGGIISEGNWYLWGIGALNFILVIIIIFVALRVVRK